MINRMYLLCNTCDHYNMIAFQLQTKNNIDTYIQHHMHENPYISHSLEPLRYQSAGGLNH